MEINADFDKRVVVHAATLPWVPSPMPGVDRRMLDRIGGKRAAALNPIRGRDKIIPVFEGIRRKRDWTTITAIRPALLNTQTRSSSTVRGAVETLALEIDAGKIAAIYAVRNPEKLIHRTLSNWSN